MAYLSDFLKNGSMLQGNAGNLAINANDLLEINGFGQVYSAKVSDYAAVGNSGAYPVAATVATSFYATGSYKKMMCVNPADSSIFVTAPYLTSNYGLEIFKYTSAGGFVGSVILDTSSYEPNQVTIIQLSNNNLAVIWMMSGVDYFAILDQYLNVIVAKTTIASNSGTNTLDAIALSGGGFAVTYPQATGAFLAVYSNTGAVVSAGSLITSSPTAGLYFRMVQLSNGNIAIAIKSSTTSEALGFAICSAAGAVVNAYTVLDSATSTSAMIPEINSVNGSFCCATFDGTNVVAYSLTNTGVLQGGAYSNSISGIMSLSLPNDGVNFWLLLNSSTNQYIAYIPASGTGFVTTAIQATSSGAGMVYDQGFLIVFSGTAPQLTVFQPLSSGVPLLVNSISSSLSSPTTSAPYISAVGDFSVLLGSINTSTPATSFAVQKYLNTAIAGVSQGAVAAGNAGAVITYSMGPGGYPCNALLGTIGKGFDHSATAIIGNKGTMLGNSVALAGIV